MSERHSDLPRTRVFLSAEVTGCSLVLADCCSAGLMDVSTSAEPHSYGFAAFEFKVSASVSRSS